MFLQIKIATKPGWQNIVRGQVYVLSLSKGKCNNLSEIVFYFVLQITTVDEACSLIHVDDCSGKCVTSLKKIENK